MNRTVKIYDSAAGIELQWGTASIPQLINKMNVIEITQDDSLSMCGIRTTMNDVTKIFVDDVTVPTVANVDALYAVLSLYLGSTTVAVKTSDTFTNADLVAGVLTITHNLGTESIAVYIMDPSGVYSWIDFTVVDTNSCTVDFGGAIGAGNWTWIVIG